MLLVDEQSLLASIITKARPKATLLTTLLLLSTPTCFSWQVARVPAQTEIIRRLHRHDQQEQEPIPPIRPPPLSTIASAFPENTAPNIQFTTTSSACSMPASRQNIEVRNGIRMILLWCRTRYYRSTVVARTLSNYELYLEQKVPIIRYKTGVNVFVDEKISTF